MKLPFLKSKKPKFEFSFVENLQLERIEKPTALITWVEQENARLLEEGSTGSVLITKKDGSGAILYAKSLVLPVADADFDEMLYDFYTKKEVPFDQNILNGPVLEENSASLDLSSQLVDSEYMPVPELTEDPDEESDPFNENMEEDLVGQSIENILIEQAEEIASLKAELAKKNRTEDSNSIPIPKEPLPIPSEQFVESPIPIKKEALTSGKPSYTIIEDKRIETPVSFTARSFDQRVSAFIDQELKNIEDEIKLVDKREMIEADVKETIKQEETRMLQLINQTITEEKTKAIESEKLRHQKELQSIEQKFVQELTQKQIQTVESYEREAKERISKEYERQTEAIERIIQVRISLLNERQDKLSSGLSEKLHQILAGIQEGKEIELESGKQAKDPSTSVRA